MKSDNTPVIINNLARIDAQVFKQIFRTFEGYAVPLEKECCSIKEMFTGNFTFGKYKYDFTVFVLPDKEGTMRVNTIRLKWKMPNGCEQTENIALVNRKSNLIAGAYYTLFLTSCGPCKYLYQNNNGLLLARKQIDFYHYASQHQYKNRAKPSRQTLMKMGREIIDLELTDPCRKYGKEYYNGRLTPYGRRIERYELKFEKVLARHPMERIQNYEFQVENASESSRKNLSILDTKIHLTP